MDPITLGLLTGVLGSSVGNILLTLRKKRPVVVKQMDVKCPFCDLLITGDNDLDRQTHVLCIADATILHQERKAEEEQRKADALAEEARRKEADNKRKTSKKYTSEATKLTYVVYSDRHRKNCYVTWKVWSPAGQLIDKGYAPDLEDARYDIEESIQAHKDNEAPIGELTTNWTREWSDL